MTKVEVPHDLKIKLLSTEDVTACILLFNGIEVTGSAKRHPDDAVDLNVGVNLALGRALTKLGVQLEVEALLQSRVNTRHTRRTQR